jgi:hypothetical protein
MTSASLTVMRSGISGLVLLLASGAVAPAVALDIDVGVGVGSSAGVGASVGPAGVSVSIGPGTDPAGPPSNPSRNPSSPPASGPSRDEVLAASRRECVGTGNSTVYDNYIVYDRTGLAVGVVKSANVGADLQVQRFTLSTLTSFAKPAECLTLSDRNMQIGAGAMRLSLSGNVLLRAIASK